MEWSKIKTVIIIMLLLVNAALLILFAIPQSEAKSIWEKEKDDVVAVLGNNGISIGRSIIPDGDTLYEMEGKRDTGAEEAAVLAILGETEMTSQGGNIYFYSGQNGWAQFWSNGNFEFSIEAYSSSADGEIRKEALALLESFGFDADESTAETHTEGDEATFTAAQETDGLPIYNCTVTVSCSNGSPTGIAGKWLTSEPSRTGSEESIDPVTCLIVFLRGLNDTGAICSSITEMSQGYIATAQASGIVKLTPVWRVTTDTGIYYVDAITGELIQS